MKKILLSILITGGMLIGCMTLLSSLLFSFFSYVFGSNPFPLLGAGVISAIVLYLQKVNSNKSMRVTIILSLVQILMTLPVLYYLVYVE